MIYRILLTIFLTINTCVLASANSNRTIIEGKVASKGEYLSYASIELREQKNSHLLSGVSTAEDGSFKIAVPYEGKFTLTARFLGYRSKTIKNIEIIKGKSYSFNFELEEEGFGLNEVVVKGLSESERVSRLAYNVQMMETTKFKHTTLDLAQTMDKISGVKIREDGGVGSNVGISLNGFSGRHIKIFIDGVPMEGMGSAFALNNIPSGLAKRVEVYKGVVPIWLGGDALGGAINIITDKSNNTSVNASYSAGSFNTHKSNVYVDHTTKGGFYVSFNAYQNYSDNDYKVDARIVDLEGGSYSKEKQTVRRFHAQYHNETAIAKFGLVDKNFADKLLFGFVLGNEYKELQNASDMNFVYGERYNTATTILPSVTYEKKLNFMKGLHISFNGNYNFGKSYANDTSLFRYNWLGESRRKAKTATPGELSYLMYHYRNRNAAANLNLSFYPSTQHALLFSSTMTSFSRKGYNAVARSEEDQFPRENFKNVSGLSYKYDHKGTWNSSLFLKNYLTRVAHYLDPEGGNNYNHYSRVDSYWGGGLASSYFLGTHTQIKLSFERTYRLPTGRELFGSGDGIEIGRRDLKPESSDNLNLGASINPVSNQMHNLSLDATLLYRDIKDYIRRSINQTKGTATSINEGRVRSYGVDFGCRYDFKSLYFVGGNFSYFDMRNRTRFASGTTYESTIYKDRIPNQPYLYGNLDAGINLQNLLMKKSLLSLHYMLNYMHSFYFDWPSYGGITIPQQISHDLYLSYNFGKRNSYTLSAECRNLLDGKLYDRYSLQKPGRSFAVKIGYNFNKNS